MDDFFSGKRDVLECLVSDIIVVFMDKWRISEGKKCANDCGFSWKKIEIFLAKYLQISRIKNHYFVAELEYFR